MLCSDFKKIRILGHDQRVVHPEIIRNKKLILVYANLAREYAFGKRHEKDCSVRICKK